MKKLLLLFMCLAAMMGTLRAENYDFVLELSPVQKLYFQITDDVNHTVMVVNPELPNLEYKYEIGGNLVIPDSVDHNGTRYAVTAIGNNTFANCEYLVSVTMPNTITYLGEGAFHDNGTIQRIELSSSIHTLHDHTFWECRSLSTIDLTHVDTIEYGVFNRSYVRNLHIHAGLKVHDIQGFCECPHLVLTIDENHPDFTIVDSVVYSKNMIKLLYYPATKLASTFSFPTSTHFIECELNNPHLKTLNIHQYLLTIPNIGGLSNLTSISVDSNNAYMRSINGMLCSADGTTLIAVPRNMKNVNITSPITTIGNGTLSSRWENTDIVVTLGPQVDSLADWCFWDSFFQIHINSATPPKHSQNYDKLTWNYYNGMHIYVPCDAYETYSNDPFYRETFIHGSSYNAVITANANPSCSGWGSVAVDQSSCPAILTATANTGYLFDHWSNGATDNPLNIYLSGDTTIYAVFVQDNNEYTISASVNNAAWGSVQGGGIFHALDTAVLIATPSADCHFQRWSNGETTDTLRLVVSGNEDLIAFFAPSVYDTLGTRDGAGHFDFSALTRDGQRLYYRFIENTEYDIEVVHPSDEWWNFWNGYTQPSGHLVIPSRVELEGTTYIVRQIEDYAFLHCHDITSIVIPNTVTIIGQDAFNSCDGATDITVGNNVHTIKDGAFSWCTSLLNLNLGNSVKTIKQSNYISRHLVTIHLPASLTSVSGEFFWGLEGLQSITVDPANTHYIAINGNQLYSFDGDTLVAVARTFSGQLNIMQNTKVVGQAAALQNNNITRVNFPSTVRRIEPRAFMDCTSLSSTTLPESLRFIGYDAFTRTAFTSITFPARLQSTGHSIFYECHRLQSVVMNDSLVSMEHNVFGRCESLRSVTLSPMLTSIPNGTFHFCQSLSKITIPIRVSSIGENAFEECNNLDTLIVENEYAMITPHQNAFMGTDLSESTLMVPCGMLQGYDANLVWNQFGNIDESGDCARTISITVNDTTWGSAIGAGTYQMGDTATLVATPASPAFYVLRWSTGETSDTIRVVVEHNTNLQVWFRPVADTILPDDHTSLDPANGRFDFSALTPSGQKLYYHIFDIDNRFVEVVNPNCDWYCTYDQYQQPGGDLIIPDSVNIQGTMFAVKRLAMFAFNECTSITSIVVPDIVTEIRYGAFRLCQRLSLITLPQGLEIIDEEVFTSSGLTSITLPQSVTTIRRDAFTECNLLPEINIPKNVVNIASNAFPGLNSLRAINVDIENTHYASNDGVLYNFNMDTLVRYPSAHGNRFDIPSTVTCIGDYAFFRTPIQNMSLPSSVRSIGNFAFRECTSLESFEMTDSVEHIGEWAFANSTLRSIVLSNNLKSIPYACFWDANSLKEIVLPDSVINLGNEIFPHCDALERIVLGKGISRIPDGFARDCYNLKYLECRGDISQIGNLGLWQCGQLDTLIIPAVHAPALREESLSGVPSSVKIFVPCSSASIYRAADIWRNYSNYIEDTNCHRTVTVTVNDPSFGAVMGAGVYSIGDTVTLIARPAPGYHILRWNTTSNDSILRFAMADDIAFSIWFQSDADTIRRIDQPNGIFDFSAYALSGQKLFYRIMNRDSLWVHITSPNGGDNWDGYQRPAGDLVIPDYVQDTTLTRWKVVGINDATFAYCTGLRSVTMPNTITYLGQSAFYGCSVLRNVNLSNKIDYIRDNTFAYCTALYSIVIPDGVKELHGRAFQYSALQEIDLPYTMTQIAADAFNEAYSLRHITVDERNTRYMSDNGTLYTFNMDTLVRCPQRKAGAFTVPEGVEVIADYAIDNCIGINNLVLPYSLLKIGAYAMRQCQSLRSITLPGSLLTIGDHAFEGCDHLTGITVPNSVSAIGEAAFASCGALTQAVLGSGLTVIANNTFRDCHSLASVVINSDITRFYWEAFTNCNTLTSMKLASVIPPVAEWDALNIPYSCRMEVPCGSSELYHTADTWSNFYDIVEDNDCDRDVVGRPNSPALGYVMGSGRYTVGQQVALTAVALNNCNFDHWSNGSTDNPLVITVTDSVCYTAYFETSAYHTVAVSSNATWRGTATGSGTFLKGVEDTLTATANSGYRFLRWNDGILSNPRFVTVTADTAFTALFICDTLNDLDTQYVDVFVHDTTYIHDTTLVDVFVPVHDTTYLWQYDTTYIDVFVHDTTIIHDTSFVDVFVPVHDTTYLWQYDTTYIDVFVHDTTIIHDTIIQQQELTYYNLNVATSNPQMGLAAGNGRFPEGTDVEIAAIPIQGYHFIQWSDGNTENPRVVTLSADLTLTATFGANESITEVAEVQYTINVQGSQIVVSEAGNARIRIFDAIGRLISTTQNAEEVRIFNMPASGVYMVQVGDYPAQKVVVVR